MPSQLDVFHPRHAGSPIKFSENHKALVSPAKGGSVLIIDANAKVDLRPLQNQIITVPTALALGKYLSSGRPAIAGQSALAYFDSNNIAIKGRGDEVNCLKALYTLLKAKKLAVYRWPYKLPVGIRPNPRAGVSNFKKSPVPLPPTPDQLDVMGLKAEKLRKLREKPTKAPMPDMPDGYCPVKREPPPDVGSIKPLEGNKYKGLFKHLIRENTGGVLFGDTGSVNSFKPSPQDMADIAAYRKAHPEDYAAITLIAPGNKVKLPAKAISKAGSIGDKVTPSNIDDYFKSANKAKAALGYTKLSGQVKKYLNDLELQTGIKVNPDQRALLANDLRSNTYTTKLSKEAQKSHRADFDKKRSSLISDWEKNTGQKWPTYAKDVKDKNGVVRRRKGGPYDAHHVIESSYGGPNEWWNLHPARWPDQHQGGIHRKGGAASEIFPRKRKK
jgi:hypothetical protein